MKTINELKKYVIGCLFGMWSIIPFSYVYAFVTDSSVSWDGETMAMMCAWTLFSLFVVYIVYHMAKAVKNDIDDIKKLAAKKEVKKA